MMHEASSSTVGFCLQQLVSEPGNPDTVVTTLAQEALLGTPPLGCPENPQGDPDPRGASSAAVTQ